MVFGSADRLAVKPTGAALRQSRGFIFCCIVVSSRVAFREEHGCVEQMSRSLRSVAVSMSSSPSPLHLTDAFGDAHAHAGVKQSSFTYTHPGTNDEGRRIYVGRVSDITTDFSPPEGC